MIAKDDKSRNETYVNLFSHCLTKSAVFVGSETQGSLFSRGLCESDNLNPQGAAPEDFIEIRI